jgi:hypothetical protein
VGCGEALQRLSDDVLKTLMRILGQPTRISFHLGLKNFAPGTGTNLLILNLC